MRNYLETLFTVYKLQSTTKYKSHHEEIFVQFYVHPSSNEIVLTFNDQLLQKPHSEKSYELVIGGGDEHDTSWLSIIDRKKNQQTRLRSVYTPRILSHDQPKMFWIQIGSNESTKSTNQKFIKFGRVRNQQSAILSWPVKNNFVLNEILTEHSPENNIDIR